MSFCTTSQEEKSQERTGRTRAHKGLHMNACDQCYRRKQACGKEQPSCGRCRLDGKQCTYSESRGAGRPRKVIGSGSGRSSPILSGQQKNHRVNRGNYGDMSAEICSDVETCFGSYSLPDQLHSGDYSSLGVIDLSYPETDNVSFPEHNANQISLLEFDDTTSADIAMRPCSKEVTHPVLSPKSSHSASSCGVQVAGSEFHQLSESTCLGYSGEDLLRHVGPRPQNLRAHCLDHSEEPEALDDVRPQLLAAIELGERLILSDGQQTSGGLFLILLGVIQQIDGYLACLGSHYPLNHNQGLRIIMLVSTLDFPEKFGMHDQFSSAEETKALRDVTNHLQNRVRDRMRLT